MIPKIKLIRKGKHSVTNYSIVVSKQRSKRDGKYIELLGVYNSKKKYILLNKRRFYHWISVGVHLNTNLLKKLIKLNII